MKRSVGWLLRAVLLILFAAALAFGWQAWQKSRAKPIDERYQFEAIVQADLTQTVTANGTLNPVSLISVGTQVSGTVRRLLADFNDQVQAGQVLLELDPTTLKATLEQSSGELASAEASLRLAQQDEARLQELFDQEYVSRQEMEKAIQTREAAQAQVRVARARIQRDRANLGYSVIRSPVAGVVVSREVDVGQTVAASFQTPTLFKIAQDLTRMQIDSNVAEADIGKIQVGQPVRFSVDAFSDRRFEGKVRQIRLNPITQQNVVTYNVVVAVDNPDRTLLPGMTAYLSFVVDERKDALLVPNVALRFKPRDATKNGRRPGPDQAQGQRGARSGGGSPRRAGPSAGASTVYVLRAEELAPVSIQTGISDSRFTEVTSGGLKAGDQVAVEDLTASPKAGGPSQPFRVRPF